MEEIKITKNKEKDTFNLEVGNGLAEDLNYDEMLGLVSSLTMQSLGTCKPCMGYLHKKEEHYTPKDGDFVAFGELKEKQGLQIFKSFEQEGGHSAYITLPVCFGTNDYAEEVDMEDDGFTNKGLRPATEEEKQQLLDALHKDGKDWDAEKKEIVPYKWHPRDEVTYWYVTDECNADFNVWANDDVDRSRHESGNCFRTEAEANTMADKFKELLKGE